MKLVKLLKDLDAVGLENYKNVNVKSLAFDSRNIEKGGLFFAIIGNNYDGRDFVDEAVFKGGVAVVTETKLENVFVPQIIVKNVRKALAIISKNFFNRACEKLRIIELVGTNGKTTTSTVLFNILRDAGKKVGLIGTNGVKIMDLDYPAMLTTPDPIDLHYIFEQMLICGVEYCVMEVSAQAIYYDKVFGIEPDAIIYTNITPEHLDFFKTMENYSKTKLNHIISCKNALKIVNCDDKYAKKLLKCENIVTYGLFNPADAFAIDIKMDLKKCSFVANVCDEIMMIECGFIGEYNVYNILSAILLARHYNIDIKIIQNALFNMKKVDGRFEVFDFENNNKVIVDFAHTPDGFKKVLEVIKNLRKGRIITLFGCVGYSDVEKRKKMGDIVKKYSDFVIITSDNYSDGDFERIFNDINITNHYAKIPNRREAVDFGINMMDKGDTLILLGKGAENYQKTKEGDIEYSELQTVKDYQKKQNVG